MNLTIIFLIVISIIFTIKNFIMIRKMAVSKGYKEIYHAVVAKEDNIIEKINTYIESEKSDYFKNKARLFLLFEKLQGNEDPIEVLNEIDMNMIFLDKSKYKKDHVNLNSDMFIWLMIMIPRLKKFDELNVLCEKFNDLDIMLSKHVEYKTFRAAIAYENNDNEGSKFLSELINGEYVGLLYDKQLIGVIKRIALSYIASSSHEKNIEYADELAIFSSSFIGRSLLSDLDIYEVYKPDETN